KSDRLLAHFNHQAALLIGSLALACATKNGHTRETPVHTVHLIVVPNHKEENRQKGATGSFCKSRLFSGLQWAILGLNQ
ncbi:MAG: hypothetical protein KAY37_05440, partial [Phycisphaerae bacterium]|nr:hypothetical protein [Phycisphaerae bacterium]